MQHDRIVRGAGGIDQFQLRRVGAPGLGYQRCAELDELLALVAAAARAASYECEAGSAGQRCLAISSAFTKTLRANSGASVRSTNVDLPAPLDPTTRSSRFI